MDVLQRRRYALCVPWEMEKAIIVVIGFFYNLPPLLQKKSILYQNILYVTYICESLYM